MVELKITKGFLDRYRQYKLDIIDDIAEVDFCYTALQELLNNKKATLSSLYHELENKEWIKINVISSEITSKGNKKSIRNKSITKEKTLIESDFSF